MTFFLIIALAVALFGWIKNKITCLVLAQYIASKACKPLTDAEIRECAEQVFRCALHIPNKG